MHPFDWLGPRPVRTGRIVTSGARGYLLQLGDGAAAAFLRGGDDRPIHFRTLDHARAAARRRGCRDVVLVQHYACEEACAAGSAEPLDPGVRVMSSRRTR